MPQDEKVRVHIQIYESDWDDLELLFGKSCGRAQAIREIIRTQIRALKALASNSATSVRTTPDELSSLAAGLTLGRDQPGEPG